MRGLAHCGSRTNPFGGVSSVADESGRCQSRRRTSFAVALGHYCTVKIALLLVMLPARLLTVTAKSAPLSAAVVGGVVYDALVAPVMLAPFFVH